MGHPLDRLQAAEEVQLHQGAETEVAPVGAYGIGIWILTAATQAEYDKLFGPPNWRATARQVWKVPTLAEIDTMLDELAREGRSA